MTMANQDGGMDDPLVPGVVAEDEVQPTEEPSLTPAASVEDAMGEAIEEEAVAEEAVPAAEETQPMAEEAEAVAAAEETVVPPAGSDLEAVPSGDGSEGLVAASAEQVVEPELGAVASAEDEGLTASASVEGLSTAASGEQSVESEAPISEPVTEPEVETAPSAEEAASAVVETAQETMEPEPVESPVPGGVEEATPELTPAPSAESEAQLSTTGVESAGGQDTEPAATGDNSDIITAAASRETATSPTAASLRSAPSVDVSEGIISQEPAVETPASAASGEEATTFPEAASPRLDSPASAEREISSPPKLATPASAESTDLAGDQLEAAVVMDDEAPVVETTSPVQDSIPEPATETPSPTAGASEFPKTDAAAPAPVVASEPAPPVAAVAPAAVMSAAQPSSVETLSQEERDARLKARLSRGRGRGARQGASPGVVSVPAETKPGVVQVTEVPAPTPVQIAPMTQEQKDQALKSRLRSTAPVAHGASYQPAPVPQPGPSAHMTQEQKDQALKASLRSTAPIAHGASYQPASGAQPAPSGPMTQEQKDQALKASLRSTAPIAHGASYQPAPRSQADQDMMAKASARAARPTRRQQQALTQAEQDAEAKARARSGYPMEGPPVVQGAQSYGPPVVVGSVEAATPAVRATATQAEQDAIAKSRARRGLPPDRPVQAASTTAVAGRDAGLSELERRREQRAAARAERQQTRTTTAVDTAPKPGVFANMGEDERERRYNAKMAQMGQSQMNNNDQGGVSPDSNRGPAGGSGSSAPRAGVFSNVGEDERQRRYDAKMAQMDQSHADSREKRSVAPEAVEPREPRPLNIAPRSAPSNRFSNMSEEERQRRFDLKMNQMDQNHADRREKMGHTDEVDPAQEQPQMGHRYSHTAPKSESFRDGPADSKSFRVEPADPFPPMHGGITTTADRGVAVAPDVEYGEYTSPLVPDDDLAVAIAIDDEEEEEEKFYAYAVEYDPDSKPPIYKNRRFRLYGMGGACVLVILVIVLVLGLQEDPPPAPIIYTNSPTSSPTESPTTALVGVFTSFFAKEVSPRVLIPGTPHYRAAQWIMFEDPLALQPDDQRLLQRYMMAFLYFHTTGNGDTEWRSCNPPKEGEDDNCVFLEFTRMQNDTITYVPKEGKVRWLSGQDVCKWEGVLCAGGSEVLGVMLFGQQLTGTLPTELAALPFLQQISVAYNELTGTIPPVYASLRHLLSIEVHGNMLTGTIPEEFYEQDSSSLVLFNVGDNMFEGTLDTRIGLMTDLKGLHVFENNFEGAFPTEVANLNYLSFTRFNGCEFEGELPTVLGRLAQLSELWAHENVFTGTIPSQLGNLRRLQELRLWGNQMVGTIPEQIYNLRKLSRLSVREMALTGTLSTKVGQLTDLQILRVSTNQLSGSIPSEIENLPLLRVAWLHLNLFNSSLPLNICNNVGEGRLEFLQTDCAPIDNPPNDCRCCSACCNRETGVCLLKEDSG